MRNMKLAKQSTLSILMLSAFSLTGCDYISKRWPTNLFPNTKEIEIETAKQEIKIVGAPKTEITIEKERDDAIRLTEELIEPATIADTTLIEPAMQVAQAVITPTSITIESPKISVMPPKPKASIPKTNLQIQKPSSTLVHLEQQNMKEQLRDLETRVEKITEILDKMSPAMTRLIGIESEVSNLSLQLQSLIELNKQQQLAQAPISQTTHTSFIEPVITQSHAAIEPHHTIQQIEPAAGIENIMPYTLYKIRSGDHKNKTRLVFETDQKVIPQISIDNDENIMAILFEGNEIDSNLEQRINNIANTSSLIQSAAILHHPDNNNALIAFDLKKSSNIIAQEYIAPGKESSFHRFVLDVKN